ncbi:MAG: AMP-binding protein [Gammaproteobacteria bacterium]|nr:AMP-binding protein [Gammaproteobacteria bacterium]
MNEGFDQFGEYDTTLSVIAKRAQWTPDRVYFEEIGRDVLTFAQFHALILTWAGALRRAGVGAGDRIAVLLPPSREAALGWLGAASLRAMEVPINTDYRGDILYYMLTDAAPKLLIVAEQYLDRLDALPERAPELRTVVVIDASAPVPELGVRVLTGEEFLAGVEPADDLEPPKPWDVMGIMYTGGTTGPSKGVVLPWGTQRKAAETMRHLGPQDAFYAPFAFFHGTARVPLSMMAFAGGRDVVRERFDTKAFWREIDEHHCTVTTLMPAMGRWLLNAEPAADDRSHCLREAVMLTDLAEFKQRFGIKLHCFYGQTESGNPIVRHDVQDNFRSCGRVRPGFAVRIVDEHDYDVAVGEVGELLVRTAEPWIMNLGYFGKPAQTVAAWRNGWIHTGDAMRQDADGNFYFVDRVRDYIRRRGENISSFEVEALVAQHPQVAEAAAIAVPSEHGEDEVKIVVVRKTDSGLGAEELVRFLIPRMPRFMVPRYVEFVDALPRTVASRQIRKVELRADPVNANTWDREAAGVVVPR